MLDIKFIRENAEIVKQAAKAKGIDVSIDELLEIDAERLQLLRKVEQLRHERNESSTTIARLLKEDKAAEANRWKEKVRDINETLAGLESRLSEVERRYKDLMLLVPNIVSPDTPYGESDADNVEIKRVGEPPKFDFPPKDHVALAENLGILDIPRGVKVAGSRGYFLKGAGLFLHRALQQLAIDVLADRGFTVMEVPVLVREDALVNTGFFPLGREQTYELPKDGRWLVGTSEVSLVSYFANEIVDVGEPIRLAAVSHCFRREVGSAGRDVHGLYRVHQFAKVEQVVLCQNDPETSLRMFDEITKNAEDILEMLELPYRIVAVCTGDLSQKNYKQYDIETWMPSRGCYGETHSSSILLDFQARRSNIKYRDQDGQLRYCHTLNNTAVATPRMLIPFLENHQRADGSIYIPKALRKYMNGLEELRP